MSNAEKLEDINEDIDSKEKKDHWRGYYSADTDQEAYVQTFSTIVKTAIEEKKYIKKCFEYFKKNK